VRGVLQLVNRRGLVLLVALMAGCGADQTPSGPSPAQTFQEHQSTNFTFRYTPLDAATVADTASRVEAEHARILGDLQLATMPRVTVTLYPDSPTLLEAVRSFVGPAPFTPSGVVGGPTTVHVMSPNHIATWSYANGITTIVHEFAHCVSLQINGSIANNPRWLWETIAVFESRQFVAPQTMPWLANGPPTFARLNGFDNADVYGVGYLIGEFIVSRWGQQGLGALLRNRGDTVAVTGLSEADFLAAWYDFVRRQYGLA
jgi:hypothetical protein